jgi:hypothetical protein
MKCSKGHEKKPGEDLCLTCLGEKIDEIPERKGMKSPSDKMIRSKDIITKRDERKRKIKD